MVIEEAPEGAGKAEGLLMSRLDLDMRGESKHHHHGAFKSIATPQMRDRVQARPGVTYSELTRTDKNKYENTIISTGEAAYHHSRMTKQNLRKIQEKEHKAGANQYLRASNKSFLSFAQLHQHTGQSTNTTPRSIFDLQEKRRHSIDVEDFSKPTLRLTQPLRRTRDSIKAFNQTS